MDSANLIPECREDDNQAAIDITFVEGLPDLAITSEDITLPAGPYTEGSIIPITANIRNIGASAASNIAVRLYNGNPLNGGQRIGADQVIFSLNPGTSAAALFTFDTLGHPGTNMLYVAIDPENILSESGKANNLALVELSVQSPMLPDLSISSGNIVIAPASPREGDQVAVSATITNRGSRTGNISVRVSVRSDDSGAGSEVFGETKTIYPVLELGQTATIQAVIDTTGMAGQKSIVITIDPANAIAESKEENNSVSQALFIQSSGLTSSISLDKTGYQANENARITIAAANTLDSSRASASTWLSRTMPGTSLRRLRRPFLSALGRTGAGPFRRHGILARRWQGITN